jgi:uncharacterized repeat protein (TIGR02543 family)
MKRIILFGFFFCLFSNSWATTHTVSTLEDSGPGSFRQLVTNAAADDVIEFGDLSGTITLVTNISRVDKNLTIQGNGKITIASSTDIRLWYTGRTFDFTISRIRFEGGYIYHGGTTGKLNVYSCIFANCAPYSLDLRGQAEVMGCTFFQNSSGTGTAISVYYGNGSTLSTKLTGNLFYGYTATGGHVVSHTGAGSVISGGYNIYDNTSPGFEVDNNDRLVSTPVVSPLSLLILQDAPTLPPLPDPLPTAYPQVDIYGNSNAGGFPGAVQGRAAEGFILSIPDNVVSNINASPNANGLYPSGTQITLTSNFPGAYEWLWTINGIQDETTDSPTFTFTLTTHTVITLAVRAHPVVMNTENDGPGSLRYVLGAALDGETILFSPELANATISLNSSLGTLAKKVIIQGNGVTINGNGRYQIFKTVTDISISNIHFTNAIASASNPAGDPDYGGALAHLAGTLTLTNCTFSNNKMRDYRPVGGAIFNQANLRLVGCTFIDNVSFNGGAIFNGGYGGYPTLTLKDNTFSGNHALIAAEGDVIYNHIGTITSEGGNTFDAYSYNFAFDHPDDRYAPPVLSEPAYTDIDVTTAEELILALSSENQITPLRIRIAEGVTINVAQPLPPISGTVRIEGKGSKINVTAEGDLPDALLTIHYGAEAFFSGIHFTGAFSSGGGFGASLFNINGSLTLYSCILTNCTSRAIINSYYLNISGCTIYGIPSRVVHSNGFIIGAGNLFYGSAGEGAYHYDNTSMSFTSGLSRLYGIRYSGALSTYGGQPVNDLIKDNGPFWGMYINVTHTLPLPLDDGTPPAYYLPIDPETFTPLPALATPLAGTDSYYPNPAYPLLFPASDLKEHPIKQLRDFPATDYYGHPRNLNGLTAAGAAIRPATVTFDPLTGAAPETFFVEYASLLSAPPAPSRADYTFQGWYTSASDEADKWDFASHPFLQDATTLYAHWQEKVTPPNTGGGGGSGSGSGSGGSGSGSGSGGGGDDESVIYRVIFTDGDKTVGQLSIPRGSLIPLEDVPLPEPPDGYLLLHWYRGSDPSLPWDFSLDPVTANITLRPLWQPLPDPNDPNNDDDDPNNNDDDDDDDDDPDNPDSILTTNPIDGYKVARYYNLLGIPLSPPSGLGLSPSVLSGLPSSSGSSGLSSGSSGLSGPSGSSGGLDGLPSGLPPGVYFRLLLHPSLPPLLQKFLVP